MQARIFIVEVTADCVDVAKLTVAQGYARAGHYAAALAGYLAWLAPGFENLRGQLPGLVNDLRDTIISTRQHARTAGIVANLAVGFRLFLRFALDVGAITEEERELYRDRSLQILSEVADAQIAHQEGSDPALTFIRLLSSALATGRVYLASTDGGPPSESPEAWGWRRVPSGTATELRAEGKRIGWIDGQQIFLEPDVAFAEAQRLATEQGESFSVLPTTLRKRLHERNLLAATDTKRETLTVRRTIHGQSRNVLFLISHTLSQISEDPTNPTTEQSTPIAKTTSACRVDDFSPDNIRQEPDIHPTNGQPADPTSEETCRVACRVDCQVSDDFPANPTTNGAGFSDENSELVGNVRQEVVREQKRFQ